jgi:hypothetical protein
MQRSRRITSALMAVVGVVMAGVGPVLMLQGVRQRNAVGHDLAALAGEAQRALAYQAEQATWLFFALGVLFLVGGAILAVTGFRMQPPRIVVPDSPEALESLYLRLR